MKSQVFRRSKPFVATKIFVRILLRGTKQIGPRVGWYCPRIEYQGKASYKSDDFYTRPHAFFNFQLHV
jgi:hypothetical protein